jgi:hypothetical protein
VGNKSGLVIADAQVEASLTTHSCAPDEPRDGWVFLFKGGRQLGVFS